MMIGVSTQQYFAGSMPHTVDRFASFHNWQLQRYNSRFWNPDTEAVDAFTCSWSEENDWLCPPILLIPRVIRHAQRTWAIGTLVVPYWQAAVFWPIIYPDGRHLAVFIHAWVDIPLSKDTLLLGKRGAVLFRSSIPNTRLLN